MMHKCIIVKIGEVKKRKLSQKNKLNENRGKFIGGICNMHNWYRGDGCPCTHSPDLPAYTPT